MVLAHPGEALARVLREIVELARIEVRGLRLGHGSSLQADSFEWHARA
jgi:hypothetical protein